MPVAVAFSDADRELMLHEVSATGENYEAMPRINEDVGTAGRLHDTTPVLAVAPAHQRARGRIECSPPLARHR